MPKTYPTVLHRGQSHGKHELMFGVIVRDGTGYESPGSDLRINYHVPDKMRSFVEVHDVLDGARMEGHLRTNLSDVILSRRNDSSHVLQVMSISTSPTRLARIVLDFLGSNQVVGGSEDVYRQTVSNMMRRRRGVAATVLSVFNAARSLRGADRPLTTLPGGHTHLSNVWRSRIDAAYMRSIMYLDLSRATEVLAKVVHDEPDPDSWWLRG